MQINDWVLNRGISLAESSSSSYPISRIEIFLFSGDRVGAPYVSYFRLNEIIAHAYKTILNKGPVCVLFLRWT